MNKYILSVLLILLLTTVFSRAQEKKAMVSFEQSSFVRKDDSVYINFNLNLTGTTVASSHSLRFTPVLASGKYRKNLPSVIINGKNRHKIYKRLLFLNKDMQDNELVIEATRLNKTPIHYSISVPYESWMLDAAIRLEEADCGCAGSSRLVQEKLLVGNITMDDVSSGKDQKASPMVNYITPMFEKGKARNEQEVIYLDFPSGKSIILPEYGNNLFELSKINRLVESADSRIFITGIHITGYASPEYTYAHNLGLSQARATAMKDYLTQNSSKPLSLTFEGKSENWDGLTSLVEKSQIDHRDEILSIIRDIDIFNGREKKLMMLAGGNPYHSMLADMFPKLRRCEYRVDYTITPFSVEDAKKHLTSHSSQLSLDEMFLIAETYEKGSEAFNEVFDIAVRMYPEDVVSNINAAAIALKKKDVSMAAVYLERVKDDPQAWNNTGVMYLLKGDVESAKLYFEKAAEAGTKEAKSNLLIINKLNLNH